MYGGEGGIRTHGRVTPSLVFKTRALNHSTTSPGPMQFYGHKKHCITLLEANSTANFC
jgi:hypothetical protein